MLHRIRLAMQTGSFSKFSGQIEVDETYIGGKARNMHKRVREQKIHGTGPQDKTPVLGIMDREGIVHAEVLPDVKRVTLHGRVREAVEPGSTLYTDNLLSYTGLAGDYDHRVIDHAVAYVDGQVHTNRMENFWALVKRGLHGTYVSVQPFHLFRYLDERVLAFNLREATDSERFEAVLRAAVGRRLTWNALTAKGA